MSQAPYDAAWPKHILSDVDRPTIPELQVSFEAIRARFQILRAATAELETARANFIDQVNDYNEKVLQCLAAHCKAKNLGWCFCCDQLFPKEQLRRVLWVRYPQTDERYDCDPNKLVLYFACTRCDIDAFKARNLVGYTGNYRYDIYETKVFKGELRYQQYEGRWWRIPHNTDNSDFPKQISAQLAQEFGLKPLVQIQEPHSAERFWNGPSAKYLQVGNERERLPRLQR